ncbi:Ubiquitin-like protein 4A [Saguinus oedipus]|uniref:Ubiquitin-like protein 4A n=1 Tax=Saguinus oedipus TaxID=9490 RepID=A0ABQ9UWR3_SAGOE|nr:Ubiquitin-like protein 4A [Saguinus oedipus]
MNLAPRLELSSPLALCVSFAGSWFQCWLLSAIWCPLKDKGNLSRHAADGEGAAGRECSLQVPEDELVSTLRQLVSEKLNVPPNSKLNLVVKPLEKVLLEEGSGQRLADSPPPQVWQLISKVLARHFSTADASRVLEQLQRDYERSLSRLTLDDIEPLASRFLHPEVTETMEKGFSK